MSPQKDADAVVEQLCQFARANLVAEGTEINEQSLLAEVGIDSFSLVELLLFCERAFGVTVPESHLTHENLMSLAALARCIGRLARPGATSPPAPK